MPLQKQAIPSRLESLTNLLKYLAVGAASAGAGGLAAFKYKDYKDRQAKPETAPLEFFPKGVVSGVQQGDWTTLSEFLKGKIAKNPAFMRDLMVVLSHPAYVRALSSPEVAEEIEKMLDYYNSTDFYNYQGPKTIADVALRPRKPFTVARELETYLKSSSSNYNAVVARNRVFDLLINKLSQKLE